MGKGSGVPCSIGECPNEAQRNGLCWSHVRRLQRGRQSLTAPLAQRPKSSMERATEAALAYANAEDDEDFARARDNLLKSIAAAKPAATAELTRAALAVLKERGVRLGRPVKVKPEIAFCLVTETGSVAEAARLLHVSERTLWRALARARQKGPFSSAHD